MTTLKEAQQFYNSRRKEKSESDFALQKAKAELTQLNAKETQELRSVDGRERERRKAAYEQNRLALNNEIKRLSSANKNLLTELNRYAAP